MSLSKLDWLQLKYLAASPVPRWGGGGHLKRGEPLPDGDMARWLREGLIEQVEQHGYRITDAGRTLLEQQEAPMTPRPRKDDAL